MITASVGICGLTEQWGVCNYCHKKHGKGYNNSCGENFLHDFVLVFSIAG
jgi:hypothetical protein